MSDTYYVISRTCPDHGHVYLVGTPNYYTWNACNDEGCNTISFKTPMDLTLFLLRFS